MTDAQQYLVNLLRCSLSGETMQPPGSGTSMEEIFRLAARHGVLGVLCPQAERLAKMTGREDILKQWKNQVIYEAALQGNATEELLKTMEALNQSGIRYVMVKGLCLKKLYAQPDFRFMKDADILVDKESVPAAVELLTKAGYTLRRDSMDHPTHWELSRSFGYSIELHFSLCNRNLLIRHDPTVWEKHLWENTRAVDYNGTRISALSLENELIELVVHLCTHYVGMDVSLQKIYDIGLFLKNYSEGLNTRYMDSILGPMRLLPFFHSLLAMLRDCFGLTGKLFGDTHEVLEGRALLEDMLADYGLKQVKDHVAVAKLQWYCHAERHHQVRVLPIFLILLVPLQLIKQKTNPIRCIWLSCKALWIFQKRKAVLGQAGVG